MVVGWSRDGYGRGMVAGRSTDERNCVLPDRKHGLQQQPASEDARAVKEVGVLKCPRQVNCVQSPWCLECASG